MNSWDGGLNDECVARKKGTNYESDGLIRCPPSIIYWRYKIDWSIIPNKCMQWYFFVHISTVFSNSLNFSNYKSYLQAYSAVFLQNYDCNWPYTLPDRKTFFYTMPCHNLKEPKYVQLPHSPNLFIIRVNNPTSRIFKHFRTLI